MDVTANIYSLAGNLLSKTQCNNLELGKQSKNISLNAPSEYYILRLIYSTAGIKIDGYR